MYKSAWWCNGKVSDLRSNGRGFDSRSGHYQVVTTWMVDYLWTGKPSVWLGLSRGAFTCVGWQLTLCDPIWQATLRSSVKGFLLKAIHHLYLYFYY